MYIKYIIIICTLLSIFIQNVHSINIKKLDVPFISQNIPSCSLNSYLNGEASCEMVIAYFKKREPLLENIKEYRSWITKNYIEYPDNKCKGPSIQHPYQIIQLINKSNSCEYSAEYYNNITINMLIDSINNGYPAIIWVYNYKQMIYQWIVVKGYEYNENGNIFRIFVNDPIKSNDEDLSYPIDIFLTAWDYTYNTCIFIKEISCIGSSDNVVIPGGGYEGIETMPLKSKKQDYWLQIYLLIKQKS